MATLASDILTELRGRGLTIDVTDTRAYWMINTAHAELCDLYPWPFLETTTALAAPATITDVKHVLSVNASNGASLVYIDRKALALRGVTFTDTSATPDAWYWEDHDTLTTYPVATGLVTIRYIKAPVILAAGDPILIPDRWRNVLVDAAMVRVYLDDDSFELAAPLRQEYDRAVQSMVATYFNRQSQTERIVVTEPWG